MSEKIIKKTMFQGDTYHLAAIADHIYFDTENSDTLTERMEDVQTKINFILRPPEQIGESDETWGCLSHIQEYLNNGSIREHCKIGDYIIIPIKNKNGIVQKWKFYIIGMNDGHGQSTEEQDLDYIDLYGCSIKWLMGYNEDIDLEELYFASPSYNYGYGEKENYYTLTPFYSYYISQTSTPEKLFAPKLNNTKQKLMAELFHLNYDDIEQIVNATMDVTATNARLAENPRNTVAVERASLSAEEIWNAFSDVDFKSAVVSTVIPVDILRFSVTWRDWLKEEDQASLRDVFAMDSADAVTVMRYSTDLITIENLEELKILLGFCYKAKGVVDYMYLTMDDADKAVTPLNFGEKITSVDTRQYYLDINDEGSLTAKNKILYDLFGLIKEYNNISAVAEFQQTDYTTFLTQIFSALQIADQALIALENDENNNDNNDIEDSISTIVSNLQGELETISGNLETAIDELSGNQDEDATALRNIKEEIDNFQQDLENTSQLNQLNEDFQALVNSVQTQITNIIQALNNVNDLEQLQSLLKEISWGSTITSVYIQQYLQGFNTEVLPLPSDIPGYEEYDTLFKQEDPIYITQFSANIKTPENILGLYDLCKRLKLIVDYMTGRPDHSKGITYEKHMLWMLMEEEIDPIDLLGTPNYCSSYGYQYPFFKSQKNFEALKSDGITYFSSLTPQDGSSENFVCWRLGSSNKNVNKTARSFMNYDIDTGFGFRLQAKKNSNSTGSSD